MSDEAKHELESYISGDTSINEHQSHLRVGTLVLLETSFGIVFFLFLYVLQIFSKTIMVVAYLKGH